MVHPLRYRGCVVFNLCAAFASCAAFSANADIVNVPDFVGQKESFVAETLASIGATGQFSHKRYIGIPAGHVVGQTPNADAEIDTRNEVVFVFVSSGSDRLVPNVSGLSFPDATKALAEANLALSPEQASPVYFESGVGNCTHYHYKFTVTGSNPVNGQRVPEQSYVKLEIDRTISRVISGLCREPGGIID